MKRALVTALLSTGCFLHVETSRNLPAKLSTPIEQPPSSLSAKTISDRGEDTGQQGWLAHMTLHMGGIFDEKKGGGAFGVELGATPFTLPKWRGAEAPFEAQPRIWVRPSIGWMFVDDSNLRITRGRPGAGIGPVYAEIQFFPWQGPKGFGTLMTGIGGLVDVAYEDGGAQTTLCGGPFVVFMLCARGAYLVNRGPELGLFLTMNGLATLSWAK